MKKYGYIAFLFLLFLGMSSVSAQDESMAQPTADEARRRPNLMSELGLSAQQIQQLREINRERRPKMEAAQRTFREVTRALDAAIYSDTVNSADVAARVRDVQTAQAALVKLRSDSELSIRIILTSEQLVKFRELRRRFAESRGLRRGRSGPRIRQMIRERHMQRPN